MTLYADSGQKSAALRQYQLCAQTLMEKLALAPSEDTIALYEYIRSGVESDPDTLIHHHTEYHLAVEHAIPNNLPAQLNTFIGREKEVRDVQAMLLAS